MKDELIHRYLSGKTLAGEEKELLDWLKESPANQAHFYEIKAIWGARTVFACDEAEKEKQLSGSLEQLNRSIDQYEKPGKSLSKRTVALWVGVAVTVALLLGFFFFTPEYKKADYITHINPYIDSVEVVTLSDGSRVWLRENSRLTYPEEFTDEFREVSVEGEAFFSVKPDPKHPFIVHVGEEKIRVLGTAFNVNTCFRDHMIEAILVRGSVEFQSAEGEISQILKSGQQALYSRNTKELEVNEVDANVMTSWRYGLISLSDVSIRTILQCLEDTYDVTIQMDTLQLKNRRYHFSFKRSKNISQVLEQLMFMTGVPASLSGEN